MNKAINPINAALSLGILFGALHLSWLTLVYLKYGQVFLDFISWVHFIKPVFEVESFDIVRAMILFSFTLVIGAILGFVLAMLFNKFAINDTDEYL